MKKMSRKQIVFIEWALIIIGVGGLALAGLFMLFSRISREQEQKETSDQAVSTTEQAVSSTEVFGKRTYVFSFAGDCTIGSLLEWQGSIPEDFQSVVGENWAYPFSGVKDIFGADDVTVVNLEGTFTTSEDAVEKPYRLKADPAYVKVLTEGSIEAVSTANNHSRDFKEQGFADTCAALDGAGILHTDAGSPLIFSLDKGPKIGIVSYNTVDNPEGEAVWRSVVKADIDRCMASECDLIIGFMHWGTVEYLTEPESWEVAFAHDMVSWGCDLIVGGHAHILQRMEYYNEVPIFYSMGNFCFGGNTDPDDKDSVIVQASYEWNEGSREMTRSDLEVIPCQVSTRTDLNDYCPTPCEKGSEAYSRILEKLEWQETQAE